MPDCTRCADRTDSETVQSMLHISDCMVENEDGSYGGNVTDYAISLMERHVDGDLTWDEMFDKLLKHHGIGPEVPIK